MFRKGKSPFPYYPGSPPESRNSLRAKKTRAHYSGNKVAADGRQENEISTPGWGLIGHILAGEPPQIPPRPSPVSSFSPPTDQASSSSIQLSHYYPENVEGQLGDQSDSTQTIHSQMQSSLLPREYSDQRPISESNDREKEIPVNPERRNLSFHSPANFPGLSQSFEQVAQTHPRDVLQEDSSKVERPALPLSPTLLTASAPTAERQKHKWHPKNQSNLPTSIRHEYETSDNVPSSLVEERTVVEEENKSLRSNTEALKEQVIEQQSTLLTSIRHEQAILEKNNASLVQEKSVLEGENKSLRNKTKALMDEIRSLSEQLRHLKHEMAASAERERGKRSTTASEVTQSRSYCPALRQ